MKIVDRVYRIGENVARTMGGNQLSNEYREARIEATKHAGLYHVEVKDYGATINWLNNNGDPDYSFSMDDFWFDDPQLAFEIKMRFG